MLDLTDSPLAVAFLLAAQDLTYFVVSPFTGVLADRLDRKRLMVVADIAPRRPVPGVPVRCRARRVVWVVYPLLAAMACFSAAFEPASAAALPNLVDGRRPRHGERALGLAVGHHARGRAPRSAAW